MCAVCFTGIQAVPAAAIAARAWWVKSGATTATLASFVPFLGKEGQEARRDSQLNGASPEAPHEQEPTSREQQRHSRYTQGRVLEEVAPIAGGETY